jgi:NAD(P)-dependent dehydrogenase (short-subunit alcohol dehydrogenase family)
MSKLKGKVAIVIGGSTGIGLASAKEFINEGAKVVLFARSKKDLDAAVQELGANSHAIVGDVTKLADLDRLYAETKSKFGGVDVLFVNSAQGKLLSIAETTEAIYDEMLDVNLKGSYFAFQKAISHLNKGASVILTTSWLNEIGFGGTSLISASKAALRSLVRVASAELMGNGIRVNAVSPGAIGTPFWGKLGLTADELNGAAKAITNQVPLKRFGKPEEVAKAVLFLATDDSSYIVGSEVNVDGGLNQM